MTLDTKTITLVALALIALAFQLYVSVRLIRFSDYSSAQKAVQLFLVWALPVVGALVVNLVIASTVSRDSSTDSAFTPDPGNNPPGIS